LVSGKVEDIDLPQDSFKIHAQTVVLKSADKNFENEYNFLVFGGAKVKKIESSKEPLFDYEITNEIFVLTKN